MRPVEEVALVRAPRVPFRCAGIPLSRIVEGGPVATPEFGIGKLVLTIGITFHLIVIYILSQEAPVYEWGGFGIDCAVLAGLWTAAASIHINSVAEPNVQIFCWALVWVYAWFLFYLWKMCRELQKISGIAVVEMLRLLWSIVGALWLK